jgi:hypothetical protein
MKSVAALLFTLLLASVANAASFPGFDGRYTIRTGDLNGDGRTDIFLQHDPKVIPIMLDDLTVPIVMKGSVRDFVLQQDATGNFNAVSVSDSQRAAIRQWIKREAIKLILNDFNADGLFDVLLKDILQTIPGVKDVIIFAPDSPTSLPSYVRNIDPAFEQFGKDVIGWQENPDYYEDGWYQSCVQGWAWLPVAYLTEEGYWIYTYDWVWVTYCGWRFDPTGYSVPAIYFLNALIQQTTEEGGVDRGSEPAITISTILRDLLGVPFMRDILRTAQEPPPGPKPYVPEQCKNPTGPGEAEFCDNWYASHGIMRWLRNIYIYGFKCFESLPFVDKAHFYTTSNAVCPVGSSRCNAPEVYQNESLVHPVVGYWDAVQPIWNVQSGQWTSAAPGGLGYAAMNCTTEVPDACDRSWNMDAGPIRFEVEPSTYRHWNITMKGHIFDLGAIQRTVRQAGGQVWIDTVGSGTGRCPKSNEKGGTEVFNTLDSFIKCHLAGGCNVMHPVGP